MGTRRTNAGPLCPFVLVASSTACTKHYPTRSLCVQLPTTINVSLLLAGQPHATRDHPGQYHHACLGRLLFWRADVGAVLRGSTVCQLHTIPGGE